MRLFLSWEPLTITRNDTNNMPRSVRRDVSSAVSSFLTWWFAGKRKKEDKEEPMRWPRGEWSRNAFGRRGGREEKWSGWWPVVVVALGDRKCVKLQRSAILMTPNDMPSSWQQRPVPTDRHKERARFLPTKPFARVRSRTTKVGAPVLLIASGRWTRFTESTLKMQLLIDGRLIAIKQTTD